MGMRVHPKSKLQVASPSGKKHSVPPPATVSGGKKTSRHRRCLDPVLCSSVDETLQRLGSSGRCADGERVAVMQQAADVQMENAWR
ncbi:hypothetical protein Syun_015181 [Stephania yunnanensis]|uniref:Uncharacterized protein n=1 Tax=Stephania yunnanensis TaxID=152371 RepID=A0AAP0PCK8_9MAGN